ncbi:IS21 family transposase [Marinilactibacillus psychrotolerans]|nr:IS21 family transposase [Marinilactibacillus psychrotolerans]SDD48681.1 Transposase [Marinilactibacillus psychrotolerans]
MDQIYSIKKMRNEEGYSLNKIVTETGYDWRTVRKYADHDVLPKEKNSKKRGMMYTKGFEGQTYGEIVDHLLFEDSKEKKKDRRLNKGIHRILKQQYKFEGSYRLVCQYIKDTHNEVKEYKQYERLEHPPGEGQLDFGNYRVSYKGKIKNIKLLVLTFPYSNRAFAVALPRENKECFLSGLKFLFKLAEGVPKALRIDNLAAAVVQSRGRGKEAIFTDDFNQFAAHYRFEPIACNPFSGHEKGSVENKVGYIRYNFFDDIPEFHSYTPFNDWLNQKLEEDSARIHYQENFLISELWEEERTQLLALPETAYPVFKYKEVKTNKYGEIRLDDQSIHIPRIGRNRKVILQLFWDRFKCVDRMGEIIYEGPRPYMDESQEIDWIEVFKTYRQKPRLIIHSKYQKFIPQKIKSYLLETSLTERKTRTDQMISLLELYSLSEIEEKFVEIVLQTTEFVEKDESSSLMIYDALSPKVRAK